MTMTMVLAPKLAAEEVAEIVKVVRQGLGAAHWSPRVYDFLASWCDEVEEALFEGETPPDLLDSQEDGAAPPPADPVKPAPPGAQGPQRRQSRPPRASRPGELRCPRHDDGAGQWLPITAFRRRVDLRGEKYQSWCRECTTAYAKSKYLSADTLKALVTDGVVVGTLSPSDPLLANRCPLCPEAWRPTDRIVAGGVVVFHKQCLHVEEDHGHERH